MTPHDITSAEKVLAELAGPNPEPVLPSGAEDHFYDDEGYDPDEDDGWDECGMTSDGFCTLAGSEWCDWDCPRNKP